MLPGGYAVDWLAAGTYDKSVGLSLFTLQVTHKIEENTDVERDYIVETVSAASPEVEVEVIEDFSTGYHSRNGGGDLIITDGHLPIIDVRQIEVPETAEVELTDSRDKRPAQIVFGAGVAFYGSAPPLEDAPRIKAPLLIQSAEVDERINASWPAYEAALKAANVRYERHLYPGTQHGFNNDTTPRFDAAAAKLAWERTLAHFNKYLR